MFILYHWCDDFGRKLQSNIWFNILKEVWNYILCLNLIKMNGSWKEEKNTKWTNYTISHIFLR